MDNPHGGQVLTVAEWLTTPSQPGLYAFVRDGEADRRVTSWEVERDSDGALQRVVFVLSGDRRKVLAPDDTLAYRAPASVPPPRPKSTAGRRRVAQRTLPQIVEAMRNALARPAGGLSRQDTREALDLLERLDSELPSARSAEARAAEAERAYSRVAALWNDAVCAPFQAAGIDIHSADGEMWVALWRGVELARGSEAEVTARVITWLIEGRQ
jgi:hypothetical protein